jgi:hypothetical protein
MKARLVYHTKDIDNNGDILEITIWKVPVTKDKPLGIKYSLVYIANNKRVLGYDNGEGKGDHRHIQDKEFIYKFESIDRLFRDFQKDVKNLKEGQL